MPFLISFSPSSHIPRSGVPSREAGRQGRRHWLRFAPLALLCLVLASGCNRSDPVELKILDYDGFQKLIAAHKGQVVVMDAWSTSCPPCVEEFHNLVELSHEYPRDRLACISLSFDYEGIGKPEQQRDKVLKFLREKQATFDNALGADESDEMYRKFKLASIPAVFVYGKDGALVKRFDNEHAATDADKFTYADVKKLVAELLGEK